MLIAKHRVVTFNYTLLDSEDGVLESSDGTQPLSYIHGIGTMIPGLENALEGKRTGESLNVSLPPDLGFGERLEDLVQVLPKNSFESVDELEVGMQFKGLLGGAMRIMAVTKIEDDDITVDANHPLAGLTLNFSVDVIGVREATSDELENRRPKA